jgi:GNAT superfamily N-acetyltransferase
MTVTVRLARAHEREQLEALQREASLANPGDREAVLAAPHAIVVPPSQIAAAQVFVAESGATVHGFCSVLDRGDGQTELDGLFVDPTLWRGGVGRMLVEQAKQYARAHSASWLYVIGNTHAEGFYEACGFVSYGVEQLEFGVGLLMRARV